MSTTLRCTATRVWIALALASSVGSATAAELPPPAELRVWIEEMKSAPLGPFESVRWFCKDGTVLEPRPYACKDHGGGLQYGVWNPRTVALRDGGYTIATIFAALDPAPFVGPAADPDKLDPILLERFLVAVDDGWILRRALTARGVFQSEDEAKGSRRLVLALLADPGWLAPERFLVLRDSVRLLPLGRGSEASAAQVRHRALELAERDRAFNTLRAKIHNAPDAADAEAVRTYARTGPAGMRQAYDGLAAQIDALYSAPDADKVLAQTAAALGGSPAAADVQRAGAAVAGAGDAPARYAAIARALATLRDAVSGPGVGPEPRLAALEASLRLEDALYALGTELLADLGSRTRRQRIGLLHDAAHALYGIGFIGRRQLDTLGQTIARIEGNSNLSVNTYRQELRDLGRASEWSGHSLEFHYGDTVARWNQIEPKSHLFTQDRLRGSPLLFYGRVIDGLALDANRQAGIEHDLFGRRVGAGLRALNPGLARGSMVAPPGAAAPAGGFGSDGIYLLPESTSDLPRVAGILTRGEGSSLSHVQLLARNLGIPNVVVTEGLVPEVQQRNGSRVVLAVSREGVVQLAPDGPTWDAIFGRENADAGLVIRPDLQKLNLAPAMIPLSRLRADDSGRLAGPKGANVGELKHYFGAQVPDGFVITFGTFRQFLENPIAPGGPSAWDWMNQEYPRLAKLSGAEKDREVKAFLARLRDWIRTTDPGPGFRQGLRLSLDRLGPDGTYGVFVRSDTNVEDLPGFTGAGLNLTVFNVVGFENIVDAVQEVWASPFTERSYGWRQDNMQDPQYVFPAVAVMKSFPSEKSGVLVTTDVDTGDRSWLTVAINEGVGGAVEGQAAETLKINATTGEVRLLSQATAAKRMELSPTGGIVKVPASGSEAVLTPAEIQKLIAFSKIVGQQFPSLSDGAGGYLPADVEFAFRGGELTLLQIRPFNESRSAQRSAYLSQLDARFRERGMARVNLDQVPEETS